MANSDSSFNVGEYWDKDPGFAVGGKWDKDPGFAVGGKWDKDPGFGGISNKDAIGFLREYLSGGEQYSQTGTDIPSFEVSRNYEGGGGTGMQPYFTEQIATTPAGSTGGSRGAFDPAYLEKLKQKGEPPLDPNFFEKVREQLGKGGVKEAGAPRYIQIPPDIDSPAVDRWMQTQPRSNPQGPIAPQVERNIKRLQEKYNFFGV